MENISEEEKSIENMKISYCVITTLFLIMFALDLALSAPFYQRSAPFYQRKTNNNGESEAILMGYNTGIEAADFEAGMWLMALIGTLAAAVPVAFLNPSLGFKKRSLPDNFEEMAVHNAINNYKKIVWTTKNAKIHCEPPKLQ